MNEMTVRDREECPLTFKYVEDYSAGELTEKEKIQFLEHLSTCSQCQQAVKFEKSLIEAVIATFPLISPGVRFFEKIETRLKRAEAGPERAEPVISRIIQLTIYFWLFICPILLLLYLWGNNYFASTSEFPKRTGIFSRIIQVKNNLEVREKNLSSLKGINLQVAGSFAAEMEFSEDGICKIQPQSEFIITKKGLQLLKGQCEVEVYSFEEPFFMETPHVQMLGTQTHFAIDSSSSKSIVKVFSGKLWIHHLPEKAGVVKKYVPHILVAGDVLRFSPKNFVFIRKGSPDDKNGQELKINIPQSTQKNYFNTGIKE
ncbi:anti-sigma factor family protein [Candidatus Riflebacteria bacterium]